MALVISTDRYYINSEGYFNEYDSEGPGDGVQIDWTSATASFGYPLVGGFLFSSAISFTDPLSSCDCPGEPAELPIGSDPPFPPVYPYLFSTGEVYGRDHLNANITMVRGDNYIFRGTVLNNGSVLDVSACTFTMTAKWSPKNSNAQAVFTRTNGSGITIIDGPNGVIEVELVPANTNSLPDSQVFLDYDIQMVNGAGKIFTVTRGKLKVVPDITEAS